jgi:hypothetical protein
VSKRSSPQRRKSIIGRNDGVVAHVVAAVAAPLQARVGFDRAEFVVS